VKDIRTADQFLQDIVHWGDRAMRHVLETSRSQFLTEEKTQDAVSRCIEAIGEAANRALKADPRIATDFPQFEAEKAYAARNVLSHDYFKTDPAILWSTVKQSVPAIVAEAKRILRSRGHEIP
jgi:uncharacterized protein with HEPN domain